MFSKYVTPVLLGSGLASATTLYATHYVTKSVHTLSLELGDDGSYSLTEVTSLETCGTYPSWLTLDSASRTLYCSDEFGWNNAGGKVNGSLTAISIGEDGSLSESAVTPNAPGSGVHNTIYEGDAGQYLAVAAYEGSALATYALPLEDNAEPIQVFEFELSEPGPVPDRQAAPHPHMALVDPTGGFIVVPDLGADLVRVFAIDKSNGELDECPSLNYTAGGGPRHAVFGSADALKIRGRAPRAAETILYVANELNNHLEAFAVSYPSSGCLGFSKIEDLVPYPGEEVPEGTSLAEIRLVGNSVYVSIRLDGGFDGNDSLANLDRGSNGTVTFKEITTSGGVLPRTLAFNKAGDLAAVGNQVSSNVAIVTRDPETGVLGEVVADLQVGEPGEPGTLEGLSSIIWDE